MALFSAAFWYPTSFEPFPYHLIFLYLSVKFYSVREFFQKQ